MSPLRREPVWSIAGVISIVLGLLVALGVHVPPGTEQALNLGLGAVISLGSAIWAARGVIGQDRPLVVIVTGIIPPLVQLALSAGFHLPPDTAMVLQQFATMIAATVTRPQVTPNAPGAAALSDTSRVATG